ncbi:MAG: hypothetical protein ACLFPS_05910 [Clostridia bacterium]
MKNIKVIRKKTPEELAVSIQELANKKGVFASPIHQDLNTREWISFVYYNTLNEVDESKEVKEVKKDKYIPTQEQLERWKKLKMTKKTYGLLLNKGMSKEDLKNVKSQYEAHIILNNLRRENI